MDDPTSSTARRVAALLTFAGGLWAGYFGTATVILLAIVHAVSGRSVASSTEWYLAALQGVSFLMLMLAAPLAAVIAPPKTTTRAVFGVLGACGFALGALQLAAEASALDALAWIVAVGAGAWWWLRDPPDGKPLTAVYVGWSLMIGFVASAMALGAEPVPLLVAVWTIVAGATLWSVWLLRASTWRTATRDA
ncbi:MAG TPA: hypothetical protein VGB92_08615 [Longimicrobium sp.]|jgi:hypothetical protein